MRLQDEHGLDVLMLLTGCWLSDAGLELVAEEWGALVAYHTPWQAEVVDPLRAARRAVAKGGRETPLYAQIKACEQAAEWSQLERIAAFCKPRVTAAKGSRSELSPLQHCCVAQAGQISAGMQRDLGELKRLVELAARDGET